MRANLPLRLLDLIDGFSDGISGLLVLLPLSSLFPTGSFLLCSHCLVSREKETEKEIGNSSLNREGSASALREQAHHAWFRRIWSETQMIPLVTPV